MPCLTPSLMLMHYTDDDFMVWFPSSRSTSQHYKKNKGAEQKSPYVHTHTQPSLRIHTHQSAHNTDDTEPNYPQNDTPPHTPRTMSLPPSPVVSCRTHHQLVSPSGPSQ
mmetsp:Transcript_4394/g.10101  ORF Transcript_4394/g.10101 Transcript_4394/m.10101 type:complete len:109 (-) Transcript_4394:971-1297(-)